LEKEYSKISSKDMSFIKNVIDSGGSEFKFKNIQEISDQLKIIKDKYDLYKLIEYKIIVISWDKDENRFYIKEKIESDEPISFREFLIQNRYWNGPSC
jgi:hypothetical protein